MADWVNLNGTMLPKILANDLSWTQYVPTGGDYGEQSISGAPQLPYYAGQVTGGDYGSFNMASPFSDNYMIGQVFGDQAPNAFDLRIKSQDKVGSNYRYELQDGYWTPTQYLGDQGWNTNRMEPADWLRAAGVVAMPFAAEAAFGGALGGGSGGFMGPPAELAGGGGFMGPPAELAGGGAAGVESGIAGIGGVEDLWPGATLSGSSSAMSPQVASYLGMSPEGYLLPSAVSGGSGLLSQIGNAISKAPSSLTSLAKLGGLLAGGALGSQGQEGGGQTSIPQPVPTMYGGANASAPSWGPMGPTETERRMRKEYLPGLLGGANPWGY
jgi:hypothetical protein